MRAIEGLLKLALNLGVLLLVIFTVARFTVVDVLTMPHNGMAPTLVAGDEVLVWRGADVDFTDVVVCPHPKDPRRTVISRAVGFNAVRVNTDHNGVLQLGRDRTVVVGLGGASFYDELRKKRFRMHRGEISYHGRRKHEIMREHGKTFSLRSYQLQPGMVYLLGDNRSDYSNDSRAFGGVDPETCDGQVFMRLKPAEERGDDIQGGFLDIID